MRVGIDAQSIAEVRQALDEHGDRYRRRLFTDREVEACGGWGAPAQQAADGLAARFAAKEAALKALRVSDEIPRWTDIEIVREAGGWTSLVLTGVAAELAARAELNDFEVSLSHSGDMAIAVVVAVNRPR